MLVFELVRKLVATKNSNWSEADRDTDRNTDTDGWMDGLTDRC